MMKIFLILKEAVFYVFKNKKARNVFFAFVVTLVFVVGWRFCDRAFTTRRARDASEQIREGIDRAVVGVVDVSREIRDSRVIADEAEGHIRTANITIGGVASKIDEVKEISVRIKSIIKQVRKQNKK